MFLDCYFLVLRVIPRDGEACVQCSFQGFAMVLFAVPLLSHASHICMYVCMLNDRLPFREGGCVFVCLHPCVLFGHGKFVLDL